MSDQGDFLSRWSRRKREVADAEAAVDAPKPPESDAAQPSPAPQDDEPEAAPTARSKPVFDPASLPTIESITAETDIRAFLSSGVPEELKRAALRRAWSADPAIRDFVGLSENSWDFNDPTAMAGFGPLEMTEDLRRIVAALFTPALDEHPVHDDALHQEPEPAVASAAGTLKAQQLSGDRQDEISSELEELPTRDVLSQADIDVGALQQQPSEPAEDDSTGRRCHGGALPK